MEKTFVRVRSAKDIILLNRDLSVSPIPKSLNFIPRLLIFKNACLYVIESHYLYHRLLQIWKIR